MKKKLQHRGVFNFKYINNINLLLVIAIFIFSCSKKDDSTEQMLDFTYKNMLGKWYYKETIKDDGTILPYQNDCISKKDNWVFEGGWITYMVSFNSLCEESTDYKTVEFSSSEYKLSSISFREKYYLKKLTKNEMHFQYEYINPIGLATDQRVLVLSRN